MTLLKHIPLESLEKSPLNERLTEEDYDSDEFQELLGSIEAVGDVNDPLLVRPTDGGYEVIKGSRRLEAAKKAQGVDDIRCEVDDIDDGEALLRTITDNIGSFQKDITARERALSLYQLWDEEGNTINPSATGLAKLLGVSQQTVSEWLEPLSNEWEDTIINPLSDDQQNTAVRYSVRELTARKLRSIRKTTGGGETGVWLAEQTVEHDFTIQDLATVRQHVENGASVENAVGVVTGELSIAEVEADLEDEEDEDVSIRQSEVDSPSHPPSPSQPTSASSQSSEADVAGDGGTTASTTQSSSTGRSRVSSPSSPSPSTNDSGTGTETDSPAEPMNADLDERYQGRRLVASPDEIEAAKEIRGTTDIEADAEAPADVDDSPLEISFTLEGAYAAGARAAIEEHTAEDGADLGQLALKRFLREGKWVN